MLPVYTVVKCINAVTPKHVGALINCTIVYLVGFMKENLLFTKHYSGYQEDWDGQGVLHV